MTVLDIPYWIGKLEEYNRYLCSVPLSKDYRERTTFREFWATCVAKRAELGIPEETYRELVSMRDDPDVTWAFTEIGMTQDNREMICEGHFADLPMNYYWMPEYEAVRKAVEDYWQANKPFGSYDAEVAALTEVVKRETAHIPIRRS